MIRETGSPLDDLRSAGNVMKITFLYTAADLTEAVQAQGQFFATGRVGQSGQASQPRPVNFGRGLAGWVVFVALVLWMAYLLVHQSPGRMPRPGSRPTPVLTHNFLHVMLPVLLPSLAIFSLVCFLIFRQTDRVPFYSPPLSKQQKRFQLERLLLIFVPLIFCVGIFGSMALLKDTPNWSPTSGGLALIASVPYILTLLLVWFYVFRKLRNHQVVTVGPEGSSLRSTQNFEITELGTLCSNAVYKTEWSWASFVSYLESENLFLLYTKDLSLQIIPKRAFPDRECLDSFCRIIQKKIAKGQFLEPVPALAANYSGHGFPVVLAEENPPEVVGGKRVDIPESTNRSN